MVNSPRRGGIGGKFIGPGGEARTMTSADLNSVNPANFRRERFGAGRLTERYRVGVERRGVSR
jgi:hypothetical protein